MAPFAVNWWVDKTILIHNEWGERGTGFFVFRGDSDDDPAYGSLFVVTNKHVIDESPALRHTATSIKLGVNVRKDDGELSGEQIHCDLRYPNGAPLWREHPSHDVDVLAIDVGGVIFPRDDIEYSAPHWEGTSNYAIFANAAKIDEYELGAGDEVFVAGYPVAQPGEVKHAQTYHPIVRRGIVATRIGERLEESVYDQNTPTKIVGTRTIRGFLVDGATIPGSSGSPVFLDPGLGRAVRGQIERVPPLLLGIIVETRFAPIKSTAGTHLSFAGLGLALDADTIRETLDLFP